MTDEKNLGLIPKVLLNNGDESEECHLVVYRVFAATICLLINGDKFVLLSFNSLVKIRIIRLFSISGNSDTVFHHFL